MSNHLTRATIGNSARGHHRGNIIIPSKPVPSRIPSFVYEPRIPTFPERKVVSSPELCRVCTFLASATLRLTCIHPAGRETELETTTDAASCLFKGDIAQVRVWSSPCSESTLKRLIGRSEVEADATLVCLWKADEGIGSILRNSRPLQPPKAPRGSKVDFATAGTGAEGHMELRGRWSWVSCFDPDDYVSGVSGTGSCAASAALRSAAAAGGPTEEGVSHHRPGAESPQNVSVSAEDGSVADGSQATAPSPTLAAPAGGGLDLARSLGWRSVSTAGDEEDYEEVVGAFSAGGDRGASAGKYQGREKSLTFTASAGTVAAAAGASAALGALDAIERAGTPKVSAREALLGVLGRLYQQCSVYLEPCRGNPLVESRPPLRGARPDARVQLQLVRRQERALKTVVQPEVRFNFVLFGLCVRGEGNRRQESCNIFGRLTEFFRACP